MYICHKFVGNIKVNIMWVVQYRPDNEAQPWSILESYDNKASALISASNAAEDYFMVIVIDPEGSIIWSN